MSLSSTLLTKGRVEIWRHKRQEALESLSAGKGGLLPTEGLCLRHVHKKGGVSLLRYTWGKELSSDTRSVGMSYSCDTESNLHNCPVTATFLGLAYPYLMPLTTRRVTSSCLVTMRYVTGSRT